VYSSRWRHIRLSRNGSLKASYNDSLVRDGAELTWSETLVGKLNRARTRLTGTWHLTTILRQPDGTENTCDSGPLRFTARR
jgi:hypothetical protein